MSALDEFLSTIAKDSEKKPVTALDGFLASIVEPESKTSLDTFLSKIEKEKPVSRETEVKQTLLSPEAQTKVGKILAKGLDIWRMSSQEIQTEGEKLILKSVDDVEQTKGYLETIQKKIGGLDFMKVLMTPMGKYYASLGMRVPTPSMIVEKVAPQAFELPEDWETTYPPWVSGFIKSVGGEPNAAVSKFSQMIFLDSLAFGGMDAILGKLMPVVKAGELAPLEARQAAAQTISDLNKMSPEGLAAYNREMAQVALAKQEPHPFYVDPHPIEENTAIVNGIKYSTHDGMNTVAQPIKVADRADELIARKMSSLENEAPQTSVPKDLMMEDILPNSGEVDFQWTPTRRFKQAASWGASPWNYARPAYEQVSLHKGMVDELTNVGIGYASKHFRKFTDEELCALGAVIDKTAQFTPAQVAELGGIGSKTKLASHKDILDNWTTIFGAKSDEALAAVESYRTGFNKWWETLGMPGDQAIKDYMPHVVQYFANRNLEVPLELELSIKNYKRFLKERGGAPEYSLNIEKNYKVYNSWASRYLATKKYREPIQKAIADIWELAPEYGHMARDYVLNYFGEFRRQSGTYRAMMKGSGLIGKTLSDSLLANNLSSPFTNTFGGQFMGFSALGTKWIKGMELAGRASLKGSAEAVKWEKRWRSSGLADLSNVKYYQEASSLTDLLIKKTLGPNAMSAIDDWSYKGMQVTETCNKKPMFMGAFDKAEKIANIVIQNPGKSKRLEQWLQHNRIDITKDLETELQKFAHYQTVKYMQDYSRAGQNALNMMPGVSSFMRVANYSFRAGETIATDVATAAKYLWKASQKSDPMLLKTALTMPETQSALRFALLFGASAAATAKAGISLDKFMGIQNFFMTSSPLVSTTNQIIKSFQAMDESDPQWVKKVLKSVAVVGGFKLTAPLFQIARYWETAQANNFNYSKNWTVYAGDPRLHTTDIVDEVDPLWFTVSILSPVQFNNMDEYRKWIKENAKKQRKNRNMTKQIEIAKQERDYKKVRETHRAQRELKREQELEKRKLLMRFPEMEIR